MDLLCRLCRRCCGRAMPPTPIFIPNALPLNAGGGTATTRHLFRIKFHIEGSAFGFQHAQSFWWRLISLLRTHASSAEPVCVWGRGEAGGTAGTGLCSPCQSLRPKEVLVKQANVLQLGRKVRRLFSRGKLTGCH